MYGSAPPPPGYIGNYWKKSSRCNKVIAYTVTFVKIVSQNAPDCISEHIHCKTFPGERGGGATKPCLEAGMPSATLDFSPK